MPSTWTWNGGVQMMLPWATSLDVEYTGLHGYNIVEQPDLNAIDFGTAFLPAYQDPTLASTIPGAAAVPTDVMRAIRGYGAISMFMRPRLDRLAPRSRSRSTAGSATACRSASTTRSCL